MKKFAIQALSTLLILVMSLSLVACDVGDNVPDVSPEPVSKEKPESEPGVAPEPTPELSTDQEPEAVGNRFPFSFSSVDLQGNTVTDEDLGEKDLYVAYLWAVW